MRRRRSGRSRLLAKRAEDRPQGAIVGPASVAFLPRRYRNALPLFIVAVLTTAAGGRAQAYVRTVNAGMTPVYWKDPCPTTTIYIHGFDRQSTNAAPTANFGMSVAAIVKSVTAAAYTWSADAVSCADGAIVNGVSCTGLGGGSPALEIVPTLAPLDAKPPRVGNDGRNTVIFRTDMWTKSGVVPPPNMPSDTYDPSGLAVTTVTSEGDGHIVDVDMEINAVPGGFFQWVNLDPGTALSVPNGDAHGLYFDLQAALTHEFGHFIGLAHTCFTPSALDIDAPAPDDENQKPVPNCSDSNLPSTVLESVMYPQVSDRDTSNRTLKCEDIKAVCAIYPPSSFHEACPLDNVTPGCAVAPSPRPHRAPIMVTLLMVLTTSVAAVRRRRARLGRVTDPDRARAPRGPAAFRHRSSPGGRRESP
jgi:hypothetical protein